MQTVTNPLDMVAALKALQQPGIGSIGRQADAYRFPVVPGTPEWETLETHSDMLRATQIPQEVLDRMSTGGLIETVLNYPLLGDFLAYDNLQHGFDQVTLYFNGLQSLLSREDAGRELLTKYRAMDPTAINPDWSIEQQGEYDHLFTYLEMLLAQHSILGSLSSSERRDLMVEASSKARLKAQRADIYGQFGMERTALIMGRALQLEPQLRPQRSVENTYELERFLREGSQASADVWRGLRQQMNESSLGDFTIAIVEGPQDYNSTVKTPNGTSVPVIVRTWELTAAQITANNNYVRTAYPNAAIVSNSSRRYNCHSYAWHSSTPNTIWINTPNDDKYWLDGSYRPSYNICKNGRKASYKNADHSAIQLDCTQMRSKWGPLPLMRHPYNHCPYNSTVIGYYERF
jgi:hypothetical protein